MDQKAFDWKKTDADNQANNLGVMIYEKLDLTDEQLESILPLLQDQVYARDEEVREETAQIFKTAFEGVRV